MLKTSRRGQLIGKSIALIFVTVVIAVFLIAFYMLARGFTSPSQKSIEDLAQSSSQNMAISSLKAYLQTPVDISYNGKDIPVQMIDLIRITDMNNSYSPILQKTTHDIFDRAYGDKYGIDIRGKNILMVFPPNARTYSSCERIPFKDGVEVTLCLK